MKTIQIGELTFRVTFEQDDYSCAPWEEFDGYGIVSEWTTRNKLPGERVLCTDRRSSRYYDVSGTMQIAKRDGWNAPPYTGTRGERAARAVEADYQYLRGWCNGDWTYLCITVALVDEDGKEVDGYSDSLCGVESFNDYHETRAQEMCTELARQWKRDNRFADAMACGV